MNPIGEPPESGGGAQEVINRRIKIPEAILNLI
jgi:hypothetical protein